MKPCWVVAITLLTLASTRAAEVSVVSITPDDLIEFEDHSPEVRRIVECALALTTRELGYRFGSNCPEKGGMDCSGAVQFALKSAGIEEVPRSSFDFFQWVSAHGTVRETKGVDSVDDSAFEGLEPGDLLFWEGTYQTARNPPISHVMIYLGRLKSDGRGVVFGASDGRRFRGTTITGVSVFDWSVPPQGSSSRFVAYAAVPGLSGEGEGEKEEPDKNRGKHLKSVLDKWLGKRDALP